MNEQPAPLDLSPAETALERGDYGQCLEQLSPLADSRPLPDPEGARIRLLMVTALMGQGRDQEALSICQLLSRSGEPQLRQQARHDDLQERHALAARDQQEAQRREPASSRRLPSPGAGVGSWH